MIRLQTTGRHYELDDKIQDYVDSKLAKLDKYLPKTVRDGLAGSVVLECDESHTQSSRFVCEIQVDVKGERMQAREATMNMYAAIDICEEKLKSQFLRYKSKREPGKNRRQRLFAKMLGRDVITIQNVEESR